MHNALPGQQAQALCWLTRLTLWTWLEVVPEAHSNVFFRMCGNCKTLLATDVLLAQVDIPLRARVEDLNVDSLVVSRGDIRGDDDECTRMCSVPDAFRGGETGSLEGELDGVCGLAEQQEDCREPEER